MDKKIKILIKNDQKIKRQYSPFANRYVELFELGVRDALLLHRDYPTELRDIDRLFDRYLHYELSKNRIFFFKNDDILHRFTQKLTVIGTISAYDRGIILGYPPSACQYHSDQTIPRSEYVSINYHGIFFGTVKSDIQNSIQYLLEHTPVPIELQSGIYEITKNPENPNKFIAKEIIIN